MVDNDGYVPFPPPGDSVADPPLTRGRAARTSPDVRAHTASVPASGGPRKMASTGGGASRMCTGGGRASASGARAPLLPAMRHLRPLLAKAGDAFYYHFAHERRQSEADAFDGPHGLRTRAGRRRTRNAQRMGIEATTAAAPRGLLCVRAPQ